MGGRHGRNRCWRILFIEIKFEFLIDSVFYSSSEGKDYSFSTKNFLLRNVLFLRFFTPELIPILFFWIYYTLLVFEVKFKIKRYYFSVESQNQLNSWNKRELNFFIKFFFVRKFNLFLIFIEYLIKFSSDWSWGVLLENPS